jgi:hypothetical protein
VWPTEGDLGADRELALLIAAMAHRDERPLSRGNNPVG